MLSAVAAAAAVLSAGTAQVAAADPGGGAPDAATRLDGLYRQAEQATQKYDAAQERTERLRADLSTLQDRAARAQQRVNSVRDELGTLAASQYRGGGIDPSLALLFSDNPDAYLEQASALDRIGDQQAGRLRRLQGDERVLDQQRAQAADKLTELRQAGAVLRQRERDVRESLARAQRLLNAMPAAQRAGYTPGGPQRASRDRPGPALDLGDLPFGDLPAASPRAALALAAARQMLGAPYVWGATGPNAFDCSGLMQYAYRRAGVALPRTSQEQMNAGRHVPLSEARPGDLVIYRGDASHVAMYVGGGRVIHAPYPGARVRYDPVAMMPVNTVTRP